MALSQSISIYKLVKLNWIFRQIYVKRGGSKLLKPVWLFSLLIHRCCGCGTNLLFTSLWHFLCSFFHIFYCHELKNFKRWQLINIKGLVTVCKGKKNIFLILLWAKMSVKNYKQFNTFFSTLSNKTVILSDQSYSLLSKLVNFWPAVLLMDSRIIIFFGSFLHLPSQTIISTFHLILNRFEGLPQTVWPSLFYLSQ